jgi:hypothetical protein
MKTNKNVFKSASSLRKVQVVPSKKKIVRKFPMKSFKCALKNKVPKKGFKKKIPQVCLQKKSAKKKGPKKFIKCAPFLPYPLT